jgi:hypothetical protein
MFDSEVRVQWALPVIVGTASFEEQPTFRANLAPRLRVGVVSDETVLLPMALAPTRSHPGHDLKLSSASESSRPRGRQL